MIFCIGVGNAWGTITSGTANSTPSISGLPNNWKGDDGEGSSYVKLIASSHYILTEEFCQNGFTSIVLNARTYGGPDDSQKVITAEWVETGGSTTTLGTVSPSGKSLANCTISVASATNTAIGSNTLGKIKLSCKGASSDKGSGIASVTINYTSGSCVAGPTITTSSSMTTFSCNLSTGVPTAQYFSVSGTNLTANLTVTPPSGYEICLTSGGTYQTSAISLTPSTGTVSSTTIYVRLKDTNAAGSYSGNIVCASTDATTKNVAISGSTPFTVTWQANGGTHATTYVAYATGTGTDVGTLPDEPDPADYSCSGKDFYGWYTGSYSHLTTAPTPLVTTSTKVTKDTTFVAVFADEEVGDPAFSKYQLVTSALSDWSGKYVLSTGTYTATGSYASNALACDAWTPSTTEATSREFVIAKIASTSDYSIALPGGKTYIGYKVDGTKLTSSTTAPTSGDTQDAKKMRWTPGTSYIANVNSTDRKLALESVTPPATPDEFKAYQNPENGSTYPVVHLYKRIEEASVTYSDFVTTCSSSKVKTPQISLSAGTYIGSQSVTITCGTADATIYYTTDNSTPSSSNGSTYSSAITISSTTTLKAIAVKDGLDDSNVASAAYTIRACKTYSLVSDVSTLGIGDKIVILETGGSCALNTTQNASSYRETTTDFALSGSNVRVPDAACDVQAITLEPYPNASGYWYFNVGADAYLFASSSSSANLRTDTKATVGENGKWSIALATGVFTVKTNGDKTNNTLRYNYNGGTNPRFTVYGSATQTAVKVYALQNTSPTVYVSTTSLSGFSATYGSASEKQDLIIYARNLTGNLTVTPPSGYEIKKSGDSSYSTSAITITPSTGSVTETVNIRIASGTSVGSPSGNISIAGNGNEVSTNVAVSGTVSKATPVITFTLGKSSALLNEEVGYTLSTTIDGTLTFSYVRGGSSVSAMITNDTENKTISISQKGTYQIRVNEASPDADKYNAAAQVECELVVSARDTFKDLVNGYSDITRDDDGSGTTTPTFAEMEDGATNGCNSTTRALIGWIKASDLETQYGTAGETGYLEDAASYNAAKLIAPGEDIEGTGVTWYAVWGEAE